MPNPFDGPRSAAAETNMHFMHCKHRRRGLRTLGRGMYTSTALSRSTLCIRGFACGGTLRHVLLTYRCLVAAASPLQLSSSLANIMVEEDSLVEDGLDQKQPKPQVQVLPYRHVAGVRLSVAGGWKLRHPLLLTLNYRNG